MASASSQSPRPERTRPWVAFAAGVVATLAVVLAWWLLSVGRNIGDDVKLVAPAPSDLPVRLPEMPDLPTAPTPSPR